MKKFYFTGIISMIWSIIFSCAFAQHPFPPMFVDRNTSNARILRFYDRPGSKFDRISSVSIQDLFVVYTRKAVDALLLKINYGDGIRIYFARDIACDFSSLPANMKEDKVVLLFAAEPEPHSKPLKYYLLNDNGIDDKVYQISNDCAEEWIQNYEEVVQPELRKTIVQTPIDPDNDDQTVSDKYSDTKSVFFACDSIDGAFTHEEGLPHLIGGQNQPITAYKVSFSAYGPKGNGHTLRPIYKNRLFIQFDYMYTSETGKEILYLEDLDDYVPRFNATKLLNQKKNKQLQKNKGNPRNAESNNKETMTSLNNGLLCPTHCP